LIIKLLFSVFPEVFNVNEVNVCCEELNFQLHQFESFMQLLLASHLCCVGWDCSSCIAQIMLPGIIIQENTICALLIVLLGKNQSFY